MQQASLLTVLLLQFLDLALQRTVSPLVISCAGLCRRSEPHICEGEDYLEQQGGQSTVELPFHEAVAAASHLLLGASGDVETEDPTDTQDEPRDDASSCACS